MKVKLISSGLWGYDFRYNKKRYRQTFAGLSKDQVQSKCIEKLEELRKQKFGLSELEPSKAVSFDDFSKEYLENYATKKKSEQTYRYHIDRLKKTFGGKTLKSITFDQVEAFQKKREQEVSSSTVNREIACLSGLLSYAVKKGKLARHPFRGKLDMLKEHPKERRILTDDECSRLLAVAGKSSSPFLKVFITVDLNTGMRPSEILALRWRDIDYNHHSIRIEQSKTDRGNRQGRTAPMNMEVELALRGLKRTSEFIFFNSDTRDHVKGIKTSFMKACEDANIKGVTPYCLRHTVATKLVNELGVDIVTAGRILGHRKIEMTLRYCHPSETTLKRAVDLIGFDWSKKRTEGEEGPAVQPPASASDHVS